MPPLEEGEVLTLLGLDPKQHFTQPPPRFTEASLVKTLEERGIGRPSTYAQILGTIIKDRGYVHRERRHAVPHRARACRSPTCWCRTSRRSWTSSSPPSSRSRSTRSRRASRLGRRRSGTSTSSSSATSARRPRRHGQHQGRRGDGRGVPGVRQAAGGEAGAASASSSRARPIPSASTPRTSAGRERPADEPTDEICPTCGKPMVIKHGRFGKFIACSGYPGVQDDQAGDRSGIACPSGLRRASSSSAARASAARRSSRCSNYPDCNFVGVAAAGRRAVPQVRRPVPDRAGGRGGKRTRALRARGAVQDEFDPRGRAHRGMKDPLAAFLASPRGRAKRLRPHPPQLSQPTSTSSSASWPTREGAGLAAADRPRACGPTWRALHARGLRQTSIARKLAARAELLPLPRAPRRRRGESRARRCAARRQPRKLPSFLPKDESKRAGRRARPGRRRRGVRDRAILELLYATGLRVAECCGPRPRRRSIAPSSTVRVLGKGRKERIVPVGAKAARRARGVARPARERSGPAVHERARGATRAARGAHASSGARRARRYRPAGDARTRCATPSPPTCSARAPTCA